MSIPFNFRLTDFPSEAETLRLEVREFLSTALVDVPKETRAETWYGADEGFSRKVGERGWIGLSWPTEFGGSGRSAMERYVVLEEMLTAGAPVGAHWIADRQSGPLIIRYGTPEQQEKILPGILKGETYFCIGMSEPDSGSDLAALRTQAEKKGEKYIVNGTKLWTSGAQRCQYMIALFRTSKEEDRHGGLTQFIVDLTLPGVTIRPIIDLAGRHHFNEVIFEDVEVPETMLIGKEGDGWNQVTAELALERSGPERFLSHFTLLDSFINEFRNSLLHSGTKIVGKLISEIQTLRRMSFSVASMLQNGESPETQAAFVKELGNKFEKMMIETLREFSNIVPLHEWPNQLQNLFEDATLRIPSNSLRGGTTEIMKGIIARQLGLR